MPDSWNRLHRRHQLVHAVLDDIATRGRPAVPALLVAAVDAEFGDLGGLLREVQLRWYRGFDARLDQLLEDEPAKLPAALAELWRALAEAMPGARLLLDAHAGHPALAALDEHHRRTLLAAIGVSHDARRWRSA